MYGSARKKRIITNNIFFLSFLTIIIILIVVLVVVVIRLLHYFSSNRSATLKYAYFGVIMKILMTWANKVNCHIYITPSFWLITFKKNVSTTRQLCTHNKIKIAEDILKIQFSPEMNGQRGSLSNWPNEWSKIWIIVKENIFNHIFWQCFVALNVMYRLLCLQVAVSRTNVFAKYLFVLHKFCENYVNHSKP